MSHFNYAFLLSFIMTLYNFNANATILNAWGTANISDNQITEVCDHSAFSRNNNLYILNGYNDNVNDIYVNNNLLEYNIETKVFKSINTPVILKNRLGMMTEYIQKYDILILFGGNGKDKQYNDLWIYNFTTNLWININNVYENNTYNNTKYPNPRGWGNLIAVKDFAVLEGGAGSLTTSTNYETDLNDMWILNLTTYIFSKINVSYHKGTDGSRMVYHFKTDTIFKFGGYSCITKNSIFQGGQQCYSNELTAIDTINFVGKQVIPYNNVGDQKTIVPSHRAYHTMTIYNDVIYIIGGGFQDYNRDWYYYNDVYGYDIYNNIWIEMSNLGTPMQKLWSHTALLINNYIYVIGGCAPPVFTNDIKTLMLNISLDHKNMVLQNKGNIISYAGAKTTIQLKVKNLENLNNEYIDWATGLSKFFDINVIGIDNSNILFVKGDIFEINQGIYNIEFTINKGNNLKLYVQYRGRDIPNSPFSIENIPNKVSPEKSIVSSKYLNNAVKGKLVKLFFTFFDQFSNVISDQNIIKIFSENMTFTINNKVIKSKKDFDANFYVEYEIPKISDYLLEIKLNENHFFGSPFSVKTYDSIEIKSDVRDGFAYLSIIGYIYIVVLIIVLYKKKNLSVIKASSINFMAMILIGAIVTLTGLLLKTQSSLLYISQRDALYCSISFFLTNLGFMLVFGSLLLKSYRIMKIFSSSNYQVVNISDYELFIVITFFVLIEILINGLRYFFSPFIIEYRILESNPVLDYYICSADSLWSIISYSYKLIMILAGLYIAFKSRKAPVMFNEATVICIVVFNISFVSLVVLGISYGFTSQSYDPNIVFILECSGILYSVISSVSVIFIPKFVTKEKNQQIVQFFNTTDTIQLELDTIKKENSILKQKVKYAEELGVIIPSNNL